MEDRRSYGELKSIIGEEVGKKLEPINDRLFEMGRAINLIAIQQKDIDHINQNCIESKQSRSQIVERLTAIEKASASFDVIKMVVIAVVTAVLVTIARKMI